MPNADDLVNTAQAATLAGKHVATINRWVARGLLQPVFTAPHAGDRGMRLYRRADVVALADSEVAASEVAS